jgi:hypothetical protein
MRAFYCIWVFILVVPVQIFAQLQFEWQIVYDAPETDSNNQVLTSTEVVDMVTHKGKIYAATSNWNNPLQPFKGQVIVKNSHTADWLLDVDPPGLISRASSIKSVVFQTDINGQALVQPDTILFIGLTTHDFSDSPYPGKVAWRNDSNGTWTYYDLDFSNHHLRRTEVRSMGFYRDKVTNADIVFAGATPDPLGIFAGRYDATQPNKIVWDNVAEFLPVNYERILGFAECNGVLYAATKSRILKRNDGHSVSQCWVELIDFKDPQYFNVYSQGLYSIYANDEDIRSFTTTTLYNPVREVLTFTTFNRLFHFDPLAKTLIEEINLKDWLQTETGNQYNYIQSGIISPFYTSQNDTFQLIGIEAIFDTIYLANNSQPNFEGIDNKGFIIVRQHLTNGTSNYQLQSISDPLFPNDTLTRVRTIINSPFQQEPGTIYAGGFAPWGNDIENTGWIYKGQLAQVSSVYETEKNEELIIFPNPANTAITISTEFLNEPYSVRIFNAKGSLVLSKNNQNSIDISSLLSGVYLICIQTNQGMVTRKMIKQ